MLTCRHHDSCLTTALQHAEQTCQRAGARLTPVRRAVLELLWASHQPRKAYELLNVLHKTHAAAKPPTIYRALDFLSDLGLVHKLQSLNAYIGCVGAHDHQYLICDDCGQVEDIQDEQLTAQLQTLAQARQFTTKNLVIELQGQCGGCRA